MLADPIREAYVYPPSDGAVALILATEERARPNSPIGRSGSRDWARASTVSFWAIGICRNR